MYASRIRARARKLRRSGATLPEIAKVLCISKSTAYLWCVGIQLSPDQKDAIQRRRNVHRMTPEERKMAGERLAPYRTKYSDKDLLRRIQDFHAEHGRIPLKREFNAWDSYALHFRSWNAAIEAAGFSPNPVLFSRKFLALDGHRCDSFSESIIDDWLFEHGIAHERHVLYGATKFTADFRIGSSILLEFFGLAGVHANYDANIARKRSLARKMGYELIEVYPEDLYPTHRLATLLKEFI